MPADDPTRRRCPRRSRLRRRWRPGSGPWSSPTATRRGETAATLRDHLDYLHGVETFMNTIQGVSVYAIREGFLDAGIADGDVLIFSELMDSRSLFLTANADTVYFWSFLDLSQGPLVLETPSDTLGLFDDMWFRWITDFGLPGADRGQGGTYLLVGPELRRAAARGRLLRPALAHQPRDPGRPGVHQREPGQRPRPDRRPDQGAAEDLPLRRRAASAAASAPT